MPNLIALFEEEKHRYNSPDLNEEQKRFFHLLNDLVALPQYINSNNGIFNFYNCLQDNVLSIHYQDHGEFTFRILSTLGSNKNPMDSQMPFFKEEESLSKLFKVQFLLALHYSLDCSDINFISSVAQNFYFKYVTEKTTKPLEGKEIL